MPDISVQFYATREELMPFVADAAQKASACVVAIRLLPFEAKVVSPEQIDVLQAPSSGHERIAFSLQPPVLPASDGMDFSDKNPNCLRLDIGKLSDDGLAQSWLVVRTEDDLSFDAWKKIAKQLKKITRPGVTGISQKDNNDRSLYKSFRYTEGAKALEDRGTPMLPPQGPQGPKMKLGDVTQVPQ